MTGLGGDGGPGGDTLLEAPFSGSLRLHDTYYLGYPRRDLNFDNYPNSICLGLIKYLYMVPCCVLVAPAHPPPPWYGPPMLYTRNPREGRHFCLKSVNSHRDGPPEPAIFVSVVAFEAKQPRGVSKVATLTWMGHGFGLRRAQLLTLYT